MSTFNLPFGIYLASSDHLDAKYAAVDEAAMFALVTNGLVKPGAQVYREDLDKVMILGSGGTNSDWKEVVDEDVIDRANFDTTAKDTVANALNEVLALTQAASGGAGIFDHDASGGLLPTTGSGDSDAIVKGDQYYVTVAGTVSGLEPTEDLEVGDLLIAKVDGASAAADFIVQERNQTKATLGQAQGATDDQAYMTSLKTREQIRTLFEDSLIDLLNAITDEGSGEIITDSERAMLLSALQSASINTIEKINALLSEEKILSEVEINALLAMAIVRDATSALSDNTKIQVSTTSGKSFRVMDLNNKSGLEIVAGTGGALAFVLKGTNKDNTASMSLVFDPDNVLENGAGFYIHDSRPEGQKSGFKYLLEPDNLEDLSLVYKSWVEGITGDKDDLTTDEKDSLVAAINEINAALESALGGGLTTGDIVNDFSEDPDDNEKVAGANAVYGIKQTADNAFLKSTGISALYADLKAAKDGDTLIPGVKYTMTDFATKHRIPGTSVINTGPNEPLILTAVANNEFSKYAHSPTRPQDEIIYDIDDDVCEDATTPRNGFIQRRTDTIKNISFPYDWRAVKNRVWLIESQYFHPVTKPTSGTFVGDGDLPSFTDYLSSSQNSYVKYLIDFGGLGVTHDESPTLSLTRSGQTKVGTIKFFNGTTVGANEIDGATNNSGKAWVYWSYNHDAWILINGEGHYDSPHNKYLSPLSSNLTIGDNTQFTVDSEDYIDVLAVANSATGGTCKNIIVEGSDGTIKTIVFKSGANGSKNVKFGADCNYLVFDDICSSVSFGDGAFIVISKLKLTNAFFGALFKNSIFYGYQPLSEVDWGAINSTKITVYTGQSMSGLVAKGTNIGECSFMARTSGGSKDVTLLGDNSRIRLFLDLSSSVTIGESAINVSNEYQSRQVGIYISANHSDFITFAGDIRSRSIFDSIKADAIIENVHSDTGTADAYVVEGELDIKAYTKGLRVAFIADNNSTGASTLNYATLGAVAIKNKSGDDVGADDIVAGTITIVQYTGTVWQLLTGATGGGGGTSPIGDVYTNIAALIAAQGVQEEGYLYKVTDASADDTVDSGAAWYQYLGTTVGDLTDYNKLSEVEAFTENLGDLALLNKVDYDELESNVQQRLVPKRITNTSTLSDPGDTGADFALSYSDHDYGVVNIVLQTNILDIVFGGNYVAGYVYRLAINQDATGGRTITGFDVDTDDVDELIALTDLSIDTSSKARTEFELFFLQTNSDGVSSTTGLFIRKVYPVPSSGSGVDTTTGSIEHTVDGDPRTIDFASTSIFTLTLSDNLGVLTLSNLPDICYRVPVVLRIINNGGYSISSIANLDNADDIFPDYSTTDGENSVWYVYKTSTGVRVVGHANVD